MSQPRTRLVIDARPRGPAGPLAAECVQGRTVLGRLIELALELEAGPIDVHSRAEETAALRSLVPDPHLSRLRFVPGPPPAAAAVLRSDRLYDERRLRRALRRNRDPEVAVVWRLDRPAALAGAGDELLRRRAYQPLGRFWALSPARGLARLLAPSGMHPNVLTLAAGLLMLGGAAVLASGTGTLTARCGIAAAFALALILDTADGHLARLQGRSSAFGRWLDATLDELADMAIHAAVAWAAFVSSGSPMWLVAGMVYGMGKYVFFTSNTIWEDAAGAAAGTRASAGDPAMGASRMLAHWAGHADVRWHAWIVLAACGELHWELIFFAVYYPLRAVAGAARKARGLAHA